MGIEPGRYENEFRLKEFETWLNQLIEHAMITLITYIRREWDVKRIISPAANSDLVHSPNTRIEIGRVKMNRDEENRIIFEKDVLGAVTMVHIVVDDCYSFGLVGYLSMTGGRGDIVEDAETTHPIRLGMVARRANQGKAVLSLAGHDPVYGRRAGTSRQACQREAFAGHVGVPAIQQPAASRRDLPDILYQLVGMNAPQLFHRSRCWRQLTQIGEQSMLLESRD